MEELKKLLDRISEPRSGGLTEEQRQEQLVKFYMQKMKLLVTDPELKKVLGKEQCNVVIGGVYSFDLNEDKVKMCNNFRRINWDGESCNSLVICNKKCDATLTIIFSFCDSPNEPRIYVIRMIQCEENDRKHMLRLAKNVHSILCQSHLNGLRKRFDDKNIKAKYKYETIYRKYDGNPFRHFNRDFVAGEDSFLKNVKLNSVGQKFLLSLGCYTVLSAIVDIRRKMSSNATKYDDLYISTVREFLNCCACDGNSQCKTERKL